MRFFIVLFLALLCWQSFSQNPYFAKMLSMKERAEVIDTWLAERAITVLPELMNRTGIDFWLIIAREYNEYPVLKTFLPST